MAIHHGHTRTGGTDAHRQRCQASRRDLAEDLADLAPDFVFFFGDVRNHVVDDIEAEHTTVAASAGDRLQGGHDDCLDTERSSQWGQGDDQTYSRTVGIWCDKTLPATLLALSL